MATCEPLDILLAHDRWATLELLGVCRGLTEEEFGRVFPMGVGSLKMTVGHMVWAMMTWTDTLEGREVKGRPAAYEAGFSAGELVGMHERAFAAFEAAARRHPVEGVVKRVREGREHLFSRGAVITHVATHGMHHRAQCLNMLRQLGVKKLPASSVAEWTRLADGVE